MAHDGENHYEKKMRSRAIEARKVARRRLKAHTHKVLLYSGNAYLCHLRKCDENRAIDEFERRCRKYSYLDGVEELFNPIDAHDGFFSRLTSLWNNATASVDQLPDTLNSVDNAASSITSLTATISSMLETMKVNLEAFTTSVQKNFSLLPVKKILSALLNSIALKSFIPFWQCFCDLCLDFGVDIALYEKFLQAPVMQHDGDGDYIQEIWHKYGTYVPTALTAIVTTVLCFCSGIEFSATKILTFSGIVGRGVAGIEKTWQAITSIFKSIEDWFSMKLFGTTRDKLKKDKQYPNIERMIAASTKVMSLPYKQDCARSKVACSKIIKLFETLSDYEQLALARKDQEVAVACRTARITMKPAVEFARVNVSLNNDIRVPPVIIKLYGRSGVGKTELMQLCVQDLTDKYYAGAEYRNLVFDRKVENEYWDGYCNHHKIVKYDDAFQLPDSIMAPNPEYMEIIRISNTDPYQLHMSAVEDKKETYFNADFVFITTNDRNPTPVSLKCPDAFRRRITLDVEVKVDPRYGHNAQVGNATYTVVDKVKLFKEQNPGVTDAEIQEKARSGKMIIKPSRNIYSCDVSYVDHITGQRHRENMSYQQLFDKINYFRSCNESDHSTKDGSLFIAEESDEFKECFDFPQAHDGDTIIRRTVDNILFDPNIQDQLTEELFLAIQDLSVGTYINIVEREGKLYPYYEEEIDTQALRSVTEEILAEDEVLDLSKVERIKGWVADKWMDVKNISHKVVVWIMDNLRLIVPFVITLTGLITVGHIAFGKCGYASLLANGGHVYELFAHRLCLINCGLCKKLKANPIVSVPMVEKGVNAKHSGLFIYHPVTFSQWFSYVNEKAIECGIEVHPGFARQVNNDLINYCVNAESKGKGYFQTALMEESHQDQKYCKRVMTESHQEQRNKKTLYTESHQDIKNSKVLYTESHQDPKIKQILLTESHQDAKARKLLFSEDGEIYAQMSSDKNTTQVGEKVYNTQLVRCYSDTGRRTNGLFVKGRLMLINAHFVRDVKSFTMTNVGDPGKVRHPFTVINKIALQKHGRELDMCLIEVSANINPRSDIISNFMDHSSVSNIKAALETGKARMFKTHEMKPCLAPMIEVVEKVKIFDQEIYSNSPGGHKNLILDYATYSTNAEPGDCGSPLMIYNTSMTHKIFGVHCAGRSGEGFAQIVTQKMLKEACEGFKQQVMAQCSYEPEDVSPLSNSLSLGRVRKGVTLPRETSIRPSPLHGIFEVKKAPAILHVPGEDTLLKNAQKMTKETVLLDEQLLDKCENDINNLLSTSNAEQEVKRVLTTSEAIAGIHECEFIDGLNRSTSPGYPYIHDRAGKPGKTKWLGNGDEYIVDNPELLDAVHEMEEAAKQGIALLHHGVFTASLKDERRPIEKLHKTRVFTACNIALSTLIRKYTLGFVKHCCENRIENEIGLGTNVYSQDWNRIAKRLLSKGGPVIAGDFSNFDGSLNSQILFRIADVISSWYDDGETNKLVRQTLFVYLVNAPIIFRNQVIQLNHSQPSGNPLTTLLNCLYNSFIFRYCYLLAQGERGETQTLSHFRKRVAAVFYGDDSIIGISPLIIDWFNQETITKFMDMTGHEYTDEEKTGKCVPFRSLDEVNFLKRTFKLRDGNYVCPISKDTIEDMVMWTKRGIDQDAWCDQVLTTAAFEAHYHGEEFFNSFSNKIRNECRKRNIDSRLCTFSEYEQMSLKQLDQESTGKSQSLAPNWLWM
nr:hypothetical protein 1 [Beihai picorna-like virus 91]